MRWRLKLEEHEYDIKYTRRKDNTAADALSWIHMTQEQVDESITRTIKGNNESLLESWNPEDFEILSDNGN